MKATADSALGTPNISDQDDDTDTQRAGSRLRLRAARARRAIGPRSSQPSRPRSGPSAAAGRSPSPGTCPGTSSRPRSSTCRPPTPTFDTEHLPPVASLAADRDSRWHDAARHARATGRTTGAPTPARPGWRSPCTSVTTAELDAGGRPCSSGWLGDRSAYAGFKFGDLSWQCDASKPVAIDPVGCVKNGVVIDGALPDEMRRGGTFQWPPVATGYAVGGPPGRDAPGRPAQPCRLSGVELVEQGPLRAVRVPVRQGTAGSAEGDDEWQPWLVDAHYGTSYRGATPAQPRQELRLDRLALGQLSRRRARAPGRAASVAAARGRTAAWADRPGSGRRRRRPPGRTQRRRLGRLLPRWRPRP